MIESLVLLYHNEQEIKSQAISSQGNIENNCQRGNSTGKVKKQLSALTMQKIGDFVSIAGAAATLIANRVTKAKQEVVITSEG